MTGDYPFPDDIRNPNRREPNPFAAEDPSLDAPAPGDTSHFATSSVATEYRPVYEAHLTDRAVLTVCIGAIGLIASLSGWIPVLEWGSRTWDGLYVMPFLSLAGSLPALLIATSNLRAMRSGAMHKERMQWAMLGCFIGATGLAASFLYFTYLLMAWFYW